MSDTDVNGYSYVNEHFGLHLKREIFIEIPDTDDSLKWSNSQGVIEDCKAIGGTENAADFNNGSHAEIVGTLALCGGARCALVVKGGSSLKGGKLLITPDPRAKYDVEIAGWSDQQNWPLSSIETEVSRTDGKPVRVRFGNPCRIKLKGRVQIQWLPSLGYVAYCWAKAISRIILRIKRGAKGPF